MRLCVRGEYRLEDFLKYSDEELLSRFGKKEPEVMDYLLGKYKPLVRKKANALYLIGGDTDDLIQEGMIGLFKAVESFDQEKESMSPFMGMDATKSQFFFTNGDTPSPSLPMTRPMGPFKSRSYIGVPPISAQTNHIPLSFSSAMVLERLVTFATGV